MAILSVHPAAFIAAFVILPALVACLVVLVTSIR
jgi:hypothetical protein